MRQLRHWLCSPRGWSPGGPWQKARGARGCCALEQERDCGADTAEGPEAGAFTSAHVPCILTDVTTFGLRPSPQPFGRRPPASALGLRLPAPTSGMFIGWSTINRSKNRRDRLQGKATDLLSKRLHDEKQVRGKRKDPKSKRPSKRIKANRRKGNVFGRMHFTIATECWLTLSSQDCQNPQPSPSFVCRARRMHGASC